MVTTLADLQMILRARKLNDIEEPCTAAKHDMYAACLRKFPDQKIKREIAVLVCPPQNCANTAQR